MKRFSLFAIIWVLLVAWQGCAALGSVDLDSGATWAPVSMTANINREYRVIKRFTYVQQVPFLFLHRLSPVSEQPELNAWLQHELVAAEGDAIVNLRIKGKTQFGDFLLPIVVGLGGGLLFQPFFFVTAFPIFQDLRTYSVEGDIVKYVEAKPAPGVKSRPEPAKEVPAPKQAKGFDPETGLPVEARPTQEVKPGVEPVKAVPAPKRTKRFDPETGLPID